MKVRSAVIVVAVGIAVAGCASGDGGAGDDPGWVGSVTTEGDVTTVTNVSGSVWGGTATLVEEASIGVDAGDDAYMLGAVRGVAVHDDEMYVLDSQVPALRVYDLDGRHLRDVGAEGSGPGEFRGPNSTAIAPNGNIYVRDYGNDRIMVFSPQGDEVGTLRLEGGFGTSTPMIMMLDGTLLNYERVPSDDPEVRPTGWVVRSLADDYGGEPVLQPELEVEDWSLTARGEGIRVSTRVPFAPGAEWTIAPDGALIAGVSDEYAFEIRRRDGTSTRVRRSADAVAVDPEEADWHRRSMLARLRRNVPDWNWDGPDIPAHKPAYQDFLPDRSGRIWVIRPGPGERVDVACDDDPQPDRERGVPCWQASVSWEVFGQDGRFLGEVDVPAQVDTSPDPYIEDDTFVAVVTDELGTVMVKRYRIVLPGEG